MTGRSASVATGMPCVVCPEYVIDPLDIFAEGHRFSNLGRYRDLGATAWRTQLFGECRV